MSNKSQVRFVSLAASSYAGIDKTKKADVDYPADVDVSKLLDKIDSEQGIVLVFPENARYMQAEGDEGQGKTSLLNSLLEVTGNIIAKNAINSIDQDKRVKAQFVGLDGYTYEVRATKSTFVLERFEQDPDGNPLLNAKGNQMKSEVKQPKEMLKKLIGPAGVSPQLLKDMKPDEQITWLRTSMPLPVEVLQQEGDIKKKYKEAYDSRTEAGNSYKLYKNLVDSSPYWANFAQNEKYFTETKFDDVEEQMKDIRTRYDELLNKETEYIGIKTDKLDSAEMRVSSTHDALANLEKRKKEIEDSILRGQELLKEYEQSVKAIKDDLTAREQWLEDHSAVREEYNNFSSKINEATEFKAKKRDWEILLENKKQMDHMQDERNRLDAKVAVLNVAKKDLVKLFTPDIEGLEVCIPDAADPREGLYYQGKPLHYLAESQLWTVSTELWKKLGVQMVFVENISSLGTGAVASFNKFIKEGGYVFASMMNRAEKNLKITFSSEIK